MGSTSDLSSTNTLKSKRSVSEVGHNKNIANFNSAFQILEEMGTLYNPSNSKILLTNLAPEKIALAEVITTLNNKIPVYKNAVAHRETIIAPLGKRMTKASNYFKPLDVSDIDKENVLNQVKKIRGDAKSKKVNPDTAEGSTISTAQLSFDSKIANLAAITSQLASHQQYQPNEVEIQIPTLKNYHQELTTVSTLVNATGNALITAKKRRNDILYFQSNNIFELMKDIKAYLKSLGEAGLPYYRAIVSLQFKDINK